MLHNHWMKKSASCGFQICAYLSEWESLQNFFRDKARSSFGRVVVSGFCCPVLFVDIYSTSTEFKLSKIRNISLWPYSFYRLSYNLQKKVILIQVFQIRRLKISESRQPRSRGNLYKFPFSFHTQSNSRSISTTLVEFPSVGVHQLVKWPTISLKATLA